MTRLSRRPIAVLAIAVFASLTMQLGVPIGAYASGSVYNSLVVTPLPLAQPAALHPANPGGNTVNLCVQPLENGVTVAVGTAVFLSIDSGLFSSPSAPGGSAVSGATALTATPQIFLTVASCSYHNPDGINGTTPNAVPVTYMGPSPVRPNGRDVIAAESNASSFDSTTGRCVGPGVCNTGVYVFAPVSGYTFSAVPIAPTASLAANTTRAFSVTALDDTTPTAQPVPGAFIFLSLTSAAAFGGSATAVNTFAGLARQKLTNSPTRLGADNSGSISISYTTPATLPSSGTDTVTAQDRLSATVQSSTSYAYATTAPPPSGTYTAVTPFRICDTRPVAPGIAPNQCNTGSTGAGSGPILQGASRVITIDGIGGLPPSGIFAIVINVTAIAPTHATYLTLFPDGLPKPPSSNLDPQAGAVVANLAELGVSPAGKIDVFNDLGSINVALDVEGFVSSASSGLYTRVTPARICDTRVSGVAPNQCNASGASPIRGGHALSFNVHTLADGIPPSGVSAVVFNLTAIGPTQRTVLTAYPTGVTRPTVSNINLDAGEVVPNRVIIPVSSTGFVSVWNSVGSVNIAVDIDGWFGPGSGAQYTALTPARVCNTQSATNSAAGCTQGVVPAGRALTIDIVGIDGVPQGTGNPGSPVAVVLNVTAVNATRATFATVYPGGTNRPNASDLNVPTPFPVTNLVVAEVGVGTFGSVNLFNAQGSVNFIVDILGYYS